MLRTEIEKKNKTEIEKQNNLNCQIQFSKSFTLIHATSESTFRFCLATSHNDQRTNSYADKLDLYYEGTIEVGITVIS